MNTFEKDEIIKTVKKYKNYRLEKVKKMVYNVYSVQDTLIGFNAPFIMMNDEIAKREYFNRVEKDPNKDYLRLYKIGTFEDETGTVIGNIPECLVAGGIEKEGEENG